MSTPRGQPAAGARFHPLLTRQQDPMTRQLPLAALLLFFPALASAQDPVQSPEYNDAALTQRWAGVEEEREETHQEAAAHAEAERLARPNNASHTFVYGGTEAVRVICQPLRVCDIALQAGEVVEAIRIGDSARWEVRGAFSGPESSRQPHVLVSPLAPGLETNLVVHTSRRMYQLELCSSPDTYMPAVAFQYQDEVEAHFAALRAREQTSDSGGATPPSTPGTVAPDDASGDPVVNPSGLDFDYTVELQGRRRARRNIDWAPLRAYSDGPRTSIEMPREMLLRDAPILLLRENGEDRIVNFRLRGRYFIVDRLFREAQLIRGVGRDQQRVVIRRGGR